MAFHSPEDEWSARLKVQLDDRIALAVAAGSMDQLKAALKDGADPSATRSKGLRLAAGMGQTNMVSVLLHAGADASEMDHAALRTAARAGHAGVVSLLLGAKSDPNADDGSALIEAAKHGHAEVVSQLLAYGANPHADDDLPLRSAAFAGQLDIVRALVEAGADLFAIKGSALSLARAGGHDHVAAYLSGRMEQERVYFRSLMEGMEDIAATALRREAAAEDGRAMGESWLIRACKMDDLPFALGVIGAFGGGLTQADLLEDKDRMRRNLLRLAADNGHLKDIFDVRNWGGRFDDMRAVWEKTTKQQRQTGGMTEDDFTRLQAEEDQRRLRTQTGGFQLKPRPRPPAP